MQRAFALALVIAAMSSKALNAQGIERVVVGFGIDTTTAGWSDAGWHTAVPEIYRRWSSYLTVGPVYAHAD